MPINYQFTMALKALREVQAELGQEPILGETLFPALPDVLDELDPLPIDSLLFGIAADGLPLLLNLRDASTGPLLVVADRGSGKTLFLQFLARAAARLLPTEALRYIVLTDYPNEWEAVQPTPHRIDLLALHDPSTLEVLYELACLTEAGHCNPATLLMVDGLDSAAQLDPSGQQNLRYLLEQGPAARLWPIVSANAAQATRLPDWVSLFHTRIYGRVARPDLSAELTPMPGAGLNTLFPGAQFCLRQKAHWLRFWLPS